MGIAKLWIGVLACSVLLAVEIVLRLKTTM